jgi:hypothetical protein
VPSSQDLVRMIGRVAPCLPFRFDEDSGRLVKQDQECKTAMDSTPN